MSFRHTMLSAFALLTCLVHFSTALTPRDNLNVPCGYLDSLNITNGIYDSKTKSIRYDNRTYYPGQYGSFDYEISYEKRMPAPKHYRACVCKNTPCVAMCCPPGKSLLYIDQRFQCTENEHTDKRRMMVDLLDPVFNETSQINVLDRFGYVVSPLCDRYILSPETDPLDEFYLMKVKPNR